MKYLHCHTCGFLLTQAEALFYQGQCTACVEDDHAQLQDWKEGQPNAKLDAFFGVTDNDRKVH